MKTRKTPIRFSNAQAVKAFSNGAFFEGTIKSQVECDEGSVFLEFNSLKPPGNPDTKPFQAFTQYIAEELDKHKPPEEALWWLNVPLRIIVSLVLLGIIGLSYLPDVSGILHSVAPSAVMVAAFRILLSVLFLIVALSLVYGLLREKLEGSSLSDKVSQTCRSQLNRLFKENGATPEQVASVFKKYLIDEKKYVIILYFVNWLFEENDNFRVSKLLSILLNAHDNLRLVYLEDQQDISLGGRGISDEFGSQLASRKVSVDPVPYLLSEASRAELFQAVEAFDDPAFYRAFHDAFLRLNPSATEAVLIDGVLHEIYQKFENEGNIQLSLFLNRAGRNQMPRAKAERIIREVFKKNNTWENLNDRCKEMLIFLVYHHYFLGAPPPEQGEGGVPGTEVEEELVYKFLLMQDLVSLRGRDGITDDQLKDDINSDGYRNTQPYHEENVDQVLKGIRKMNSVEIAGGKFVLNFPAWLSEYLIVNLEDFYPNSQTQNGSASLEMHYLHHRKEDFAKYLILSHCVLFSCTRLPQSTFERLLENLSAEDKFLLSIVLSDKFTSIPFHEDRSGIYYRYGVELAEKAWRSYYGRFQEMPTSFEVFGVTFNLKDEHLCPKPFHSLYNLMSNAVNRVSFLNTSPEDVALYVKKLIATPPPEAYQADFEIFLSKFGELQSRYNFYCQHTKIDHNVPRTESRYIRLLEAVENQIFVLLPLVDKAAEHELPSFDLRPFQEASLDQLHLDFHFLLILLCIHNTYFYDKETRGLAKRSNYAPQAIEFGKRVLESFEKKLQESQRKPLNIKKNNYYNLYQTKHLFILSLFEKCDIEFDSKLEVNVEDVAKKFQFVLEKFKLLGDYFGIVDTLFWSIWFMTRLSPWTPGINNLIKDILYNIDEFLGYIHFNTGLIYMGIISNTVITPYKSYQMTKKFLDENENIPPFLKYDFLLNLHTVCYNGQFHNRAELKKECLEISKILFSEDFQDKMDPQTKNQLDLANVTLLFDDLKTNGPEIERLLSEIKPQDLAPENQGLYYYRYIQYLREKNDYSKIKELNLYEKTKKHLKNNKFYYIQFLRECVTYLDQAINQSKHDELVETYKKKINTFNNIREELVGSEKEGPRLPGIQVDEKEHRINTLNILAKEIDEIEYQLLNRQENSESLQELKQEFENYHRDFTRLQQFSGSENLPAKYLLANTADLLGKVTHNQLSLNDTKVESYYNMALDFFFELEEYIPFLRILLELKILYSYSDKKRFKQKELSALGRKASYIISYLEQKGGMHDIESANREAREISCLLYDFFNDNVSSKNRTDYHFNIGLKNKVDKVQSGHKVDGDTRGVRRYLSSFHYNFHNQAPFERLLADLQNAFDSAEQHSEALTLDDLNTLDKILPMLKRRIDSQKINQTVEFTQLEDRLKPLKNKYYKMVEQNWNKRV